MYHKPSSQRGHDRRLTFVTLKLCARCKKLRCIVHELNTGFRMMTMLFHDVPSLSLQENQRSCQSGHERMPAPCIVLVFYHAAAADVNDSAASPSGMRMRLYRAPLNATISALPARGRGGRRGRDERRCRPARFARLYARAIWEKAQSTADWIYQGGSPFTVPATPEQTHRPIVSMQQRIQLSTHCVLPPRV